MFISSLNICSEEKEASSNLFRIAKSLLSSGGVPGRESFPTEIQPI
jgi:hypothetical protein